MNTDKAQLHLIRRRWTERIAVPRLSWWRRLLIRLAGEQPYELDLARREMATLLDVVDRMEKILRLVLPRYAYYTTGGEHKIAAKLLEELEQYDPEPSGVDRGGAAFGSSHMIGDGMPGGWDEVESDVDRLRPGPQSKTERGPYNPVGQARWISGTLASRKALAERMLKYTERSGLPTVSPREEE